MNLLSINIRGGGNKVKSKKIAHLNQSGKVDISFTQESKLASLDDNLTASLWGD